jgi:hypothetical protein
VEGKHEANPKLKKTNSIARRLCMMHRVSEYIYFYMYLRINAS